MGQTELEAALRRDGDDRAREIWAHAENEAERLRSEQKTASEREEHDVNAELETELLLLTTAKQAEAARRAQLLRLEAEAALAERLRELADQQLSKMAAAGGAKLFQALASEIPDHHWQRIQVNLRDQPLVAELYPQAEIEISDEIFGGLIVQTEGGRIQIENTLGKRLHHLWPELLPELMVELRRIAGDYEPAD